MCPIFIAEFLGTMLLLLLGDGAVANVLLHRSKGERGGWIVIAAGWGFAVALGVYAVGHISGGHINPAVTLGFACIGKTPWHLVPVYIAGQLFGAIAGACLVYVTYMGHYAETEDPEKILATFCTKPSVRAPLLNCISESVATAVLLIGVCSITHYHNDLSGMLAPYLVGIVVFSIGLSLGGPTGYAINPARDFGPRLVHALLPIRHKGASDWGYAWVPIVGPCLGALLGSGIYYLASEYVFHR